MTERLSRRVSTNPHQRTVYVLRAGRLHEMPDGMVLGVPTRLWPLGDDVTFVPGHGPHSTFGQERRTNPFVSDAAMTRAPIPRPATGPS